MENKKVEATKGVLVVNGVKHKLSDEVLEVLLYLNEENIKYKKIINKALEYIADYVSREKMITYGQYKSELSSILRGNIDEQI